MDADSLAPLAPCKSPNGARRHRRVAVDFKPEATTPRRLASDEGAAGAEEGVEDDKQA